MVNYVDVDFAVREKWKFWYLQRSDFVSMIFGRHQYGCCTCSFNLRLGQFLCAPQESIKNSHRVKVRLHIDFLFRRVLKVLHKYKIFGYNFLSITRWNLMTNYRTRIGFNNTKHARQKSIRSVNWLVKKCLHLLLYQSLQLIGFLGINLIRWRRCWYIDGRNSCSCPNNFLRGWILFDSFLWIWLLNLFNDSIVTAIALRRCIKSSWAILHILVWYDFLLGLFNRRIEFHQLFGHIWWQIRVSKWQRSHTSVHLFDWCLSNRCFYFLITMFLRLHILYLIWINMTSCTQLKREIFFIIEPVLIRYNFLVLHIFYFLIKLWNLINLFETYFNLSIKSKFNLNNYRQNETIS